MDLNQTKPKRRTRSKTDEKTLRGRSVWIDETGEITGKKGTKYSEVSTTIPFGTGWITAPTIDKSGNKLSDEEVKQRLKDNQGKDFITGEKLPVFSSEEKASEYAQWRSNTMFDKEAIKEGFPEETFPGLPEDKKEEDKEGQTSLKGFIEYLFTPSRHFGTGQYSEGGLEAQMSTSGLDAEGRRRRTDSSEKYKQRVEEGQEDIAKAASFVVPFYDSGVNIANVAQEYMKPEQERDYEYIKDQFREAGQSAAIESGLLLMGGVAGKYGAKGIKALADKIKQYEIDPTAVSAFGAGAIRKKPTIKEGVPTIEAAGLTDEAIDAWRSKNETPKEFRDSLKGRNPELQAQAKRLGIAQKFEQGVGGRVASGISNVVRDTYRKLADELRPIRKVNKVPKPATNKEIVSALNSRQRTSPIIGLNDVIPEKDIVDVRLNIPAYTDYDVWVPTITHNKKEKYKAAVRIQNVKFIQPDSSNVRKAQRVAQGGEKNPFAVMTGEYVDGTDDELFTMAKEVFDSDEWTQVGYDPIKRGFFYDRETGQAILEADEVIQVGHLVLAKNAKKTDPDVFPFNKGGAVMEDQMEMAFMQEGGIADDGMDVDPVSGNEVPPGSLAEEVRDDIPAQLSEGEYVVPADVVRYYGVKFFEDLRDRAKMGLAEMEANGRIGGEPVPEGGPVNDQELSEQEMAAIREVMSMAEGGTVQNPYLQQQQMYSQPAPQAIGNTIGYSGGGQVQGYQPGGPVSTPVSSQPEAPSYARNPFDASKFGLGFSFMGGQQQQPPVADNPNVPEVLTLYGPNGEIRTFNLPLSEADAAEVARLKEMGYSETKAVTTAPVTGGGDGGSSRPPVETDPYSWMKDYDYKNLDTLKNQTITNLTKDPVPGARGLLQNIQTAAESAGHIIVLANNGASKEDVDSMVQQYKQFIKDAKLNLVPKGLLNGDKFAKDIAAKNRDIALFENSTDPFGNPIFKDDNDFNKFMEKVGPRGMEFDPTEERTVAALGEGDTPTTVTGVYKRKKPVSETLKASPRPVARPSALVKTRTDSTGKKAGDVGYESALRKRQADKRKKYQKTQREKMKAFKKREQKTGVGGRNIGGRAEGGLMNKKGDK